MSSVFILPNKCWLICHLLKVAFLDLFNIVPYLKLYFLPHPFCTWCSHIALPSSNIPLFYAILFTAWSLSEHNSIKIQIFLVHVIQWPVSKNRDWDILLLNKYLLSNLNSEFTLFLTGVTFIWDTRLMVRGHWILGEYHLTLLSWLNYVKVNTRAGPKLKLWRQILFRRETSVWS